MSKMTGFFAVSAAAAMSMFAGAVPARDSRGQTGKSDANECGNCSCIGPCACLVPCLPDAVRATIDAQTAGRRLDLVAADQTGAAVIYQARFKKDGSHWEMRIADDGTLISKEKQTPQA